MLIYCKIGRTPETSYDPYFFVDNPFTKVTVAYTRSGAIVEFEAEGFKYIVEEWGNYSLATKSFVEDHRYNMIPSGYDVVDGVTTIYY